MARTGDSSVWVSWNQSSILRGAHLSVARKRFAITETRGLSSWERLLSGGDSRGTKRGYDDGVYTSRRPDDGDTIRFRGPRNPHLFNATRTAHRAAAHRFAEHQIRTIGNLWCVGRHAAGCGRDERRSFASQAGF